MTRKKKVKIFMVVIVVLYVFSTSYGLSREDSAMDKAMKTVNKKVAAARKKISKEMDKPFLLRLFGSLFSMEGNTLENLKVELPKLLKNAMPKSIDAFTFPPEPASPTACVGMRLSDAAACFQRLDLEVEEILWSFDDQMEDAYLKLGGTILEAEPVRSGGIRIVLQYPHGFDGESGLGSGSERQRNLKVLATEVEAARSKDLGFFNWLFDEAPEKLEAAVEAGSPIFEWCDISVPFTDLGLTELSLAER